jgi:hypothetical protein
MNELLAKQKEIEEQQLAREIEMKKTESENRERLENELKAKEEQLAKTLQEKE